MTPPRYALSDWVMLSVLVACWGSAFAMIEVGLQALSPLILVTGRLAISAVLLLGVCYAQGNSLKLPWRQWGFFFVLAAVGICMPFSLISWGQLGVNSGLAGILMAITPLMTLLLSHFVNKNEHITRLDLLGFLIGFAGIVVLVGPDALGDLGGAGLIFQLAVIGGAVCYAVNGVITPFNQVKNTLVTATGTMLAATLIMLLLVLLQTPSGEIRLDFEAAAAVLFLALFSTAIPHLVFYRLIDSAGPAFYSLSGYLIPVWAVVAGVVFLQERPDWNAYGALALILSGIAISQIGRREPD
jgi:drug/metabolite transporter (DMT)-like permease